MSQENVEIVRGFLVAMDSGNCDAAVRELHPRGQMRSGIRWEADARIRTGDPFITRDKKGEEGRSHAGTSATRSSCKARAFVEWLSAGGDDVCTT
jgi:hypothetical protein